jgi:hypothetical protein
MITIDAQLHGYRQGHQLLASSVQLPKADQATIDQLSDVAGPLRPGEVFDPYLSAYPLPSGRSYVLARTWQDMSVPRAGCVRTLSLLIPMSAWAAAAGLSPFLDFLSPETIPSEADPRSLSITSPSSLPQVPLFHATELLEALFLEEAKPIALFDAPLPELIAHRLLTALWPSLRSRFSLSTFALSPRKIDGRNFDLVFAPKDVRSKFVNWPGRRIDAGAGQTTRHRWTDAIVERVFLDPVPWLLSKQDLRLMGADEGSTTAALRISLLWDELLAKLEQSPSAALGLLDIANSRIQAHPEAVSQLQPALADAALRAATNLPASEAWDILGAMIKKMHGSGLAPALPAVAAAAGILAGRSPSGAVALLEQPDPQQAIQVLASPISEGLNEHFGSSVEAALSSARPDIFGRLLEANEHLAKKTLSSSLLIKRLASIVPDLDELMFEEFRAKLLLLLTQDSHIAILESLVEYLDSESLIAEVIHLADSTGFEATSFFVPLAKRARHLSAIKKLREVLLSSADSSGRNLFLRETLTPSVDDVYWLINERRLKTDTAEIFLLDVLRSSSLAELAALFGDNTLSQSLLNRIPAESTDMLWRVVNEARLPLDVYVAIVIRMLPVVANHEQVELAEKALDRCLREHFGGDEVATVSSLLETVGQKLDGGWVAKHGLEKGVATSVVNRNLLAFDIASKVPRAHIIAAIEDVANALAGRNSLDLDHSAAVSCAQMLWDSQQENANGLLHASGRLLPVLIRSKNAPVSAMVAATFPFVYAELAKHDDVPDLFKFVLFFDWDRCKAARRELVDAFLSSTIWQPSDLMLTACRTSHSDKIIKRVGKSVSGGAYIDRIASQLSLLPQPCRDLATTLISKIRSDWSRRYNWQD